MLAEKPAMTAKSSRTHEQIIEDWIGSVKNLYKIKYTNLYDNRYRVDVFTTERREAALYDAYMITQSYFICITNGEVVNLTIKKEND